MRPATCVAIGLALGGIALAFAEPPIPDPPVPIDGTLLIASAGATSDVDCGCAALRKNDLQSQVDRHVEHWQAMHDPRGASGRRLHPRNLVEGVVGFPVRHFRLAADEDGTGTR